LFLEKVFLILLVLSLFLLLIQIVRLFGQGLVFAFDFISQLSDLMGSHLELLSELRHLIVGFNKLLGVVVSV